MPSAQFSVWVTKCTDKTFHLPTQTFCQCGLIHRWSDNHIMGMASRTWLAHDVVTLVKPLPGPTLQGSPEQEVHMMCMAGDDWLVLPSAHAISPARVAKSERGTHIWCMAGGDWVAVHMHGMLGKCNREKFQAVCSPGGSHMGGQVPRRAGLHVRRGAVARCDQPRHASRLHHSCTLNFAHGLQWLIGFNLF